MRIYRRLARRPTHAICTVLVALTILFSCPAVLRAQSAFLGDRGMAYDAFDRLPTSEIRVGNSVLHVGFAAGELILPKPVLLDWIRHSANVIAKYYGRFPVGSARILIVPVAGDGVRGGTTWGYRGAAIRLLVGTKSTRTGLERDWKIVHEMVHLALPELPESNAWLSEGLATYIEPIARVQAGDLDAHSVWADMLRDMPKGLPATGDRGLDRTHSWGRTYWGGAMFCLLVDIKLREQTGNRLGLQEAMRGVLNASDNQEVRWPIQRVLEAADNATKTQVMSTLYASMRAEPVTPDLIALWNDLGVIGQTDGSVRFDDTRPLAAIRRAIMQPLPQ